MTPANDPKYAACRDGQHTPSPGDVTLDGGEITTSCSVCGALLTTERLEWWAVFDESATCDRCDEAAPFCGCEGGPVSEDS